jgi:hypothetical protein
MTIPDLLDKAADWLEVHDWTQHAYARNQLMMPCDSHDLDAVCWCAYGAMEKVSGEVGNADLVAAEYCCRKYLNWSFIGFYNDQPGRTKDDVIATLRAIAARERAGCEHP